MHTLGKILDILNTSMETPQPYGWFHVMFLVLSVLAGLMLCRTRKNAGERFVRRLLTITAVTVMVLEVYKQINFTFHYDGNEITGLYQWYAFPFQFCSTPMYVSLAAGLVKNQKLHRALCAYLGTFAVFAGICVMVYPVQVFVPTIGINIQTMICHGSMISVGMYLLGTGYVKAEHQTIRGAAAVFGVCVALAMIMNEVAHLSGLLETHTFNMFFISPYCDPSLPVYSLVQQVVPFPWCAVIYVAAFTAAAYVILLIAMGVRHLQMSRRRETALKTA